MLHQILATGYVGYLLISKSTNPYPYAGQAHTYNLSSSSIMDIDISLLAAIGDAMTRGASAAAEQALLTPSTATSPGTIRASSLTYDPTRPSRRSDQAETHVSATPVQLNLATPTGHPVPLGNYAAPEPSTTSDLDIGLLAAQICPRRLS